LKEIEQALLQKEFELENKIQASEQKEIDLAIEGENIQAFKASLAVGKMSKTT
jgi:hypothetical protein